MRIDMLSNSGLTMLHDAVRRALAEDDAQPKDKKKYEVRELPDWREWADSLESEMSRRKLSFTRINW